MLSVGEALNFMLGAARPLAESAMVDTLHANGRVLAAPQASTLNVPERDNTQMDGYAVRAADCVSGAASLIVSQRIPAGHVGQPLQPGTAARIFTGALIPDGADAVVMQEQCTLQDGVVTVNHAPQAGEWIRRQGEDIRAGSVILAPARACAARNWAWPPRWAWRSCPCCANCAWPCSSRATNWPCRASLWCRAPSTIRTVLPCAACWKTWAARSPTWASCPIRLEATRAVLRQAAQGNDLIITSGGVSVGEEDHIKPAVEAEGRLNMWQIAVKPGKPLAFGEVGQAFFVGLPGNPVSSFVTFLLFVRPFILRLQGVAGSLAPRSYRLPAHFER